MRNAYSSLGRSVQAYQPYYAPPVDPQTEFIQGGSTVFADMRRWAPFNEHSRPVSRAPRRNGERWLYSRGPQMHKLFRMIATGTVESSAFQPVVKHEWGSVGFNDAIYGAGYPRNLGLSEKVPTLPPQALGINPTQMAPRPQFKRSIFVNRRPLTSGIPGVPATPTNGQYS